MSRKKPPAATPAPAYSHPYIRAMLDFAPPPGRSSDKVWDNFEALKEKLPHLPHDGPLVLLARHGQPNTGPRSIATAVRAVGMKLPARMRQHLEPDLARMLGMGAPGPLKVLPVAIEREFAGLALPPDVELGVDIFLAERKLPTQAPRGDAADKGESPSAGDQGGKSPDMGTKPEAAAAPPAAKPDLNPASGFFSDQEIVMLRALWQEKARRGIEPLIPRRYFTSLAVGRFFALIELLAKRYTDPARVAAAGEKLKPLLLTGDNQHTIEFRALREVLEKHRDMTRAEDLSAEPPAGGKGRGRLSSPGHG